MKSDWILWDPLAMDLNSTPSKSISWGKHHSTMLPAEKQIYSGKLGHSTRFWRANTSNSKLLLLHHHNSSNSNSWTPQLWQIVPDILYSTHLLQTLLVAAQHPDIAEHLELFLKLVLLCGFILHVVNHRAATILPERGWATVLSLFHSGCQHVYSV